MNNMEMATIKNPEVLALPAAAIQPVQVSAIETLKELVPIFLKNICACENSTDTYHRRIKEWFRYLDAEGIRLPVRETVIDFIRYLKDNGKSSNTIVSYIGIVKAFFAFTAEIGKYPDIAKSVRVKHNNRGFLKNALTVEQITALLESIDRSTLEGKRNFAICNLILRCGLRVIEVTRLDICDIIMTTSDEGELKIWGKGRQDKDEICIVTQKALMPIIEYLQARGACNDEAALFASCSYRNKGQRLTTVTISSIFKNALRAIELNSKLYTAHSGRHSCASLAIAAGADIWQVKDMMRHADISTTQRYVHLADRRNNAAERLLDNQF